MMKKFFRYSVPLFFFATNHAYAVNMAYVEVNSNAFKNVGCYIDSDSKKSFFEIASVFAANINGDNPNEPVIYLNDNVIAALESDIIKDLHAKGIKIVVTLLGNHQNAGWSCMTDEKAAYAFADKIVNLVNQYNVDGIDIDDEYSTCSINTYSMIMMAKAIKSHPGYQGKLLTKALFHDQAYFHANYQGHVLSEYLDYGWEMSYGNPDFMKRISPYIEAGMPVSHLMVGAWTSYMFPNPTAIGRFTAEHALAGVMIYDVKNSSQAYLTEVSKGLSGRDATIDVLPNCLI